MAISNRACTPTTLTLSNGQFNFNRQNATAHRLTPNNSPTEGPKPPSETVPTTPQHTHLTPIVRAQGMHHQQRGGPMPQYTQTQGGDTITNHLPHAEDQRIIIPLMTSVQRTHPISQGSNNNDGTNSLPSHQRFRPPTMRTPPTRRVTSTISPMMKSGHIQMQPRMHGPDTRPTIPAMAQQTTHPPADLPTTTPPNHLMAHTTIQREFPHQMANISNTSTHTFSPTLPDQRKNWWIAPRGRSTDIRRTPRRPQPTTPHPCCGGPSKTLRRSTQPQVCPLPPNNHSLTFSFCG